MDRHPNDRTTDEMIDVSLERAKDLNCELRIVEAVYRPDPGLEFLMLRLDDGRRLLIPREELSELKHATADQAKDILILPHGVAIWWPQLDDGLYLPEFLRERWGNARLTQNQQREVAA